MLLENTLKKVLANFNIPERSPGQDRHSVEENTKLLNLFIAAKKIEGYSENTLKYYSVTILNMLDSI